MTNKEGNADFDMNRTGTTDTAGKVTLTDVDGTVKTITVTGTDKDGNTIAITGATVTIGADGKVSVVLPDGVDVSNVNVNVVDANGNAVSGREVVLNNSQSSMTNKDGNAGFEVKSGTDDEQDAETQTIYRLYNTVTSEHLFTSSKYEYDVLKQELEMSGGGWSGEEIAWHSPKTSTVGVYRLYNPDLGAQGKMSHHYTTNKAEAEELVANWGWQYDNEGEPIFYSAVDVNGNALSGALPTYRLYNDALSAHHYTTDVAEHNELVANQGWASEGIGWYSWKNVPTNKETN